MAILGDILLLLLAVLGVLVLLVLLMPIQVGAAGAIDGTDLDFEARGSWGFGLVSVRWRPFRGGALHVLGLRVMRFRPERRRARQAKRRARKAGAQSRSRRGARWTWRHRRTLWRAALRLVRTLHLRGHVAGVVGLAEPDDTAWLGLALGELEARLPPGVLAVEVDYTDEVLALGGHVRSRVWPVEVLVVLAAVRFGGEMRRALRAA